MDKENTTTADGGNTAQQESTFTQEDVNRIVSERLAKEKAKNDTALADRERELAQREFQLKAREILESKKLPVELLGALNATDESSLNAALELLDKEFHFNQQHKAFIPNPDGTMRLYNKEIDKTIFPPSGNVVNSSPGMLERKAFGLD